MPRREPSLGQLSSRLFLNLENYLYTQFSLNLLICRKSVRYILPLSVATSSRLRFCSKMDILVICSEMALLVTPMSCTKYSSPRNLL